MTGTKVEAAPGGPPGGGAHRREGGMSTGDKVRFVLRGVGQTLITLGLVVLLFVVYEVWITNLFAERANREVVQKLQKSWDDPTLPLPGNSSIKLGTGLAILYIPRLGRDYHFGVVEGVDQNDLEKGPGHYPGTVLPGSVGNFAVAGHRVGKGEPFLNIDKLRSGDAVVVETRQFWYVYRVLGQPAGKNPQDVKQDVAVKGGDPVSLPGREIVDPSDGQVLDKVPDNPKAVPAARLMTMTTCHPKFTAAQRMIVYSQLQTKVARDGNTMPATISDLYKEVKA